MNLFIARHFHICIYSSPKGEFQLIKGRFFKVNVQGGSIIGWISDLVGLKTLGKLSNSRARLRTLLCFGSGERQRPSSYRRTKLLNSFVGYIRKTVLLACIRSSSNKFQNASLLTRLAIFFLYLERVVWHKC